MKDFWVDKNVTVLGGKGFIGGHLIDRLNFLGANVSAPAREQCDLIRWGDAMKYVVGDVVINMAAVVGGIEYNRKNPSWLFFNNSLLQLIPLQAAVFNNVGTFVQVSSACVYPRHANVPTEEYEGQLDVPEVTNRGYGWGKRVGELAADMYQDEFSSIKIAVPRPFNCYGPGDHFEKDRSHVIPALIRKVYDPAEEKLVVWGDGSPTRSFLYVDDFVEGILLSAQYGAGLGPVNIGTDEEVSIKELVETIIDISGTEKPVVFDESKPNGQPRRVASTKLAEEKLGFKARTKLYDGLQETMKWYLDNEFKKINGEK